MTAMLTRQDRETTAGKKLPFLTVDYIQLACLGKHSVRIEIHENGLLFGNVVVWQGELWSAEQGALKGRSALQTLLFAISGQVHNLDPETSPGSRNIPQANWQKILLETSLCLDQDESTELPDDGGETRDLSSNLAGMKFQELENLALDAMLEKRYHDALPALRQASKLDPGNRRVQANLERLFSLGYGEKA